MQKDRFNKHNLEYTGHLMRKGYSLTFDFYLSRSSEIDSIMGNDYAERKLMNIMMDEDSEAVKANNFSGLPDWDKMYKNLKNKYGDYYADRITTWKKIAYYYKKNEWIEFNEVLVRYIIMYRSTIPYMQLNNFAWELFNHSNVKNELELAAGWSKETLDSKEPYLNTYYDTYANLLFKLSRKKEAIKAEEMAIKLSPENEKKEFRKTLWKMQK